MSSDLETGQISSWSQRSSIFLEQRLPPLLKQVRYGVSKAPTWYGYGQCGRFLARPVYWGQGALTSCLCPTFHTHPGPDLVILSLFQSFRTEKKSQCPPGTKAHCKPYSTDLSCLHRSASRYFEPIGHTLQLFNSLLFTCNHMILLLKAKNSHRLHGNKQA